MPSNVHGYVPARAMVVVAHPDDAEFMVAGTVAKWTQAGSEVTYVVITKGDKGSDDPEMTPERLTEIREAEQRAAGAVLGVKHFEFMGYEDGYLQPTLELRRDLARLIRKYRPEVLVTFDPTNRIYSDTYVNHPDHRAAGDAAMDAVFPTARDRLTFPELLREGFEPWKVRQLWLAHPSEANTWVDVAETIELRRQALRAHPSQLDETTIEFAIQMCQWAGAQAELPYAEAFRRITLEEEPQPAKVE